MTAHATFRTEMRVLHCTTENSSCSWRHCEEWLACWRSAFQVMPGAGRPTHLVLPRTLHDFLNKLLCTFSGGRLRRGGAADCLACRPTIRCWPSG